MRAILIDDELDSLESLGTELKTYCPDIEIVASYQDPRKGLEGLRSLAPDVVFLDIEMPHLNAFELLEKIAPVRFDVIFVTAYDEYAIKAFEFSTIDYLLKPIMKAKLIQAVQKVSEKRSQHLQPQDLKALINHMHLQSRQEMENIALPTSEGFDFVPINDIRYLQSDNNYTWVHLQSQQKYLVTRTLKEMASMIAFPQFFRVHQTYFVNLNHVKKYVRGQGGYLVLKDGTQIPVSRANKEPLIRLLLP